MVRRISATQSDISCYKIPQVLNQFTIVSGRYERFPELEGIYDVKFLWLLSYGMWNPQSSGDLGCLWGAAVSSVAVSWLRDPFPSTAEVSPHLFHLISSSGNGKLG